MIIAKHARVVHSPLEHRFMVQYKTRWFCMWQNDTVFEYYPEGGKSSIHGPLENQAEAMTKASNRVDILLDRTVVYDDKR
jgi:hypothetical protein